MFQKGITTNPSGFNRYTKPYDQRIFEDRCRKTLTKEGWAFLEKMMRSRQTVDKKWALEILLDRGFGKAMQPSYNENVNHDSQAAQLTDAQILDKLTEIAKDVRGQIELGIVSSASVAPDSGISQEIRAA